MAFPTPPAYAGSKSQTSQGTGIWVNFSAGAGSSPPTWVFIGECLGAEFSDKVEFDDSTNLQSGAKEFLATLPDPGKCEVDLNRVSTDPGQAALQTLKASATRTDYAVVFPINLAAGQTTAGDQRKFQAYVEQLHPTVKANKKIMSKFSLQITGVISDIEGS